MHIHGGNIKEIAKRYGLREEKIMDFSANINPLGPPPRVIKALKENLDKIARYPDPEAIKLRKELSEYLKSYRNLNKSNSDRPLPFGLRGGTAIGTRPIRPSLFDKRGCPKEDRARVKRVPIWVNPENIIVGNGAVELIHLICHTLRPKEALIVVPTFSEYEFALKSVGCKTQFFSVKSRDNFLLDIEELLRNMKKIDLPRPYEGRGLLFLCSPNNPTGQLISKVNMLRIVDSARKRRVFVVIDEVFIDFVERAEAETLIYKAIERDNLFIIRSLTKFFALPGIRIGYGIGNRRLLGKLKIHKEYWSVNALAQIAGIAALRDREYIKKTKGFISEEREFLYHKLSRINGLKPYPSVTNFILCRLTNKMDSKSLQKKLIKKNILIRDCSSFRSLSNRYIRIAIRTRKENLRLISSLSKIL